MLEPATYIEIPISRFHHQTDEAILVTLEDDEKLWIPRSVLEHESIIIIKQDKRIYVAQWWLEKEEITW